MECSETIDHMIESIKQTLAIINFSLFTKLLRGFIELSLVHQEQNKLRINLDLFPNIVVEKPRRPRALKLLSGGASCGYAYVFRLDLGKNLPRLIP